LLLCFHEEFESPSDASRFLRSLNVARRAKKNRAELKRLLLTYGWSRDVQDMSHFSPGRLELIFWGYESLVFENAFSFLISHGGHTLCFGENPRLTSSGGRLLTNRPKKGARRFKIEISSYILARSFSAEMPGPFRVNGLPADSRLAAAIMIVEHEMVHLAEYLLYGDSNCNLHRFRHFAYAWFGHTDVSHGLATAGQELSMKGLTVGSWVEFEYKGDTLRGVINRVTKRATVLIPCAAHDGQKYNDGRYYRKMYVPLRYLRPVEGPSGKDGLE
jgi:hypothetical protein